MVGYSATKSLKLRCQATSHNLVALLCLQMLKAADGGPEDHDDGTTDGEQDGETEQNRRNDTESPEQNRKRYYDRVDLRPKLDSTDELLGVRHSLLPVGGKRDTWTKQFFQHGYLLKVQFTAIIVYL